MKDQLLNQSQTAKYLGFSRQRVAALEKQSRLTRTSDGKYKQDDLDGDLLRASPRK